MGANCSWQPRDGHCLLITGVSQSDGQKGLAARPLDSGSPGKGVTASEQRDSTLVPRSTGGLGKHSTVKESSSAGQGTGLTSKDSPKAVPGRSPPPLLPPPLSSSICMSTDVVAVLQYLVQSVLCKACMLAIHLQNLNVHILLQEC